MPRTIDDLYDKLGELIDVMSRGGSVNRGSASSYNRKSSKTEFDSPEDFEQYLRQLERGKSLWSDLKNSAIDYRKAQNEASEASEEANKALEEYNKAVEKAGEKAVENYEALLDIKEVTKEINELKSKVSSSAATVEEQEKLNELLEKEKELRKELNKNGIRKPEKYIESIEKANLPEKMAQAATSSKKMADANEEVAKYQERGSMSIQKGLRTIERTYRVVKSLASEWGKIDQAAANYAKSVGMSAQGYKETTKRAMGVVNSRHLGINYNMSADELLKTQQNISSQIGRNVGWNENGQENIAAMTAVMGENASEMMVKLENFGLSVNDSAKKSGEMFKTASEYGISFEKYSKNFLNNITIAQNYTFRNGIKGLEEMAKKSTAIRLDMQAVAGFASKVQTLEGAMDAAAQLQVLGGSFAAFSDPLSMMNEGLNDMEGLFDRVSGMIQGLGTFNQQTGQVEVSSFNKRKVAAAAQAMGMSSEQLMESVNRQASMQEIERQLNMSGGAGLNENMKELIKNNGVIENGKAGVNINGKFVGLDKLDNSMEKELIKETQSEADDIKDIARTLRGFNDMQEGFNKQLNNATAKVFGFLGQGLKWAMGAIGGITTLMMVIAAVQGGLKIGGALGGGKGFLGKGLKTLGKGGKSALNVGKNVIGKGGEFIGGAASKIGSTLGTIGGSTALGVGAGIAGLIGGAYMGINANKKRKERLANGEGKRGDDEDVKLTRQKGTGWGLAGGSAVGAAIGTMIPIPVLGTLAGAAIGAGVGALVGNYNANTRKLQGQIAQGAGAEMKGNYTRGKTKDIGKAIGGQLKGRKLDKVKAMLAEQGDYELLDAIENKEEKKLKKGKDGKNGVNGGFFKTANFHVMTANFNIESSKFGVAHGSGSATEITASAAKVKRGNDPLSFIKRDISFKANALTGVGGKVLMAAAKRRRERNVDEGSDGNSFNLNVNGTIKLDTGGERVDITQEFVNKLVAELVRNNPSLRSLGDALVKHSPDIKDLADKKYKA